jgi:hypothetical protein
MITMRPTAGEFLVNGVRVGTWHETAKGVVHANDITGMSGQYATFGEAFNAVDIQVMGWLADIRQEKG